MPLALALVLGALLAACAPPSSGAPSGRSLGLNGGAQENGHPGTVLMYWTDGASGVVCSGTVVAPRVVVSAKHCYLDFDAARWTANSGPTGATASVGVTQILMSEGDTINNEDIAVVVLGAEIGVAEVTIRRDFDGLRPGDTVTLVGYGENPDDGASGRKYSGDAGILGFGPIDEAGVGDREMLLEGAAACGGDSGGSVLDGDGALMGVIVRGADVGCAEATYTVATRVDSFLDLVDRGIAAAQGCQATGAEVCDWIDNDCNGQVDEGCGGFGQGCESTPCQPPYVCLPLGGVGPLRCTSVCDPGQDPRETCNPGQYCYRYGCGPDQGQCLARGEELALPLGSTCFSDDMCGTYYCRDPDVDGEDRCVTRCTEDEECGVGSVCAPVVQGCGACVAVDDPTRLPFGADCSADDDCATGVCGDEGFCTQECGTCPDGFHCSRDVCAAGELPDDQGRPCIDNEDCATELCAHWPEGASCTAFCSAEQGCPDGLECSEVGDGRSACRPSRTIIGQPCEENDDCLSALCGHFDDERGSACTEPCSGEGSCPVDLECLDAGDLRVCAPPVAEEPADGGDDDGHETYGCGCATAPGPGGAIWLPLCVPAAWLIRRGSRRPRSGAASRASGRASSAASPRRSTR